jgi:hypothetical protein
MQTKTTRSKAVAVGPARADVRPLQRAFANEPGGNHERIPTAGPARDAREKRIVKGATSHLKSPQSFRALFQTVGYRQKNLAQQTGVSAAFVSQVLSGKRTSEPVLDVARWVAARILTDGRVRAYSH